MSTKRVLTAELVGPALDWAVALCEGYSPPLLRVLRGNVALPDQDDPMVCDYLEYSTDWGLGGPIIEREGISTRAIRRAGHALDGQWLAMPNRGDTGQNIQWVEFLFGDREQRAVWRGPTMLVAAMRCHVARKLGDHVAVPAELL